MRIDLADVCPKKRKTKSLRPRVFPDSSYLLGRKFFSFLRRKIEAVNYQNVILIGMTNNSRNWKPRTSIKLFPKLSKRNLAEPNLLAKPKTTHNHQQHMVEPGCQFDTIATDNTKWTEASELEDPITRWILGRMPDALKVAALQTFSSEIKEQII